MHIEILNKTKEIQTVIIHLKAGEEVPLHDHPYTHVFLYVTAGELQMDCFDYIRQPDKHIWIKPTISKVFRTSDNVLMTPQENNLHHIKAITDVSFMDVVTPGYFESSNEPNWFGVVEQTSESIQVQEIPQPEYLVKAKAEALKKFESLN
tara:strand:+ start:241353 stop:241802 length:450 start_codon:yes stop_codon:yes gene_type:complete